MPLNATVTGKAVADYIEANRPDPTVQVTSAQLEALWEGIIGIIFGALETDMQIKPGTFNAPSGGGPVTGLGGPAQ